jgi:hypothetical protein
MPSGHTIAVQSPAAAPGQAIVVAGTNGNVSFGDATPRITGFGTARLSGVIPPGSVGPLKFNTGSGAGVLITPSNSSGWSGIHSLTSTRTSKAFLLPILSKLVSPV